MGKDSVVGLEKRVQVESRSALDQILKEGASVQGARLLANAKVMADIERLSKCKDDELGLSNERILEKLAEIAFSDEEATKDNLRALDILCKTRGIYLRKPEMEQESVVINLNMGGE